MRVLVVDDDRKTASFISKALKSDGFAVDVLQRGDDALQAIRVTPFDAVVLDIMLAGRDGLGVVRQLRAQGNRTPVLLLSARGEANERIEGLNAGGFLRASACLGHRKPVTLAACSEPIHPAFTTVSWLSITPFA